MAKNTVLPTGFLTTVFVALVAVTAAAAIARTGLSLSWLYPVTTAVTFAAMTAVASRYVGEHHPFAHFGPANQVTTLRAALLTLVIGLILERPSNGAAVYATTVAFLTTTLDGIDGELARRTRMTSPFGERFDMEIDALLILVLSVLAWQYGKAGSWVVLSGLLRYLFVAAGYFMPWIARPLPSSWRGKTICIVQIVVLFSVLVPPLMPPWSARVAAAGLAALSYSFLVDTLWLWRTSRRA